MALLKKVSASSLTEVTIASIVILVLFYIAIESIENILVSQTQKEKAVIEEYLDVFEYRLKYRKGNVKDTVIKKGFFEWRIIVLELEKEKSSNTKKYIIEVYNKERERVAVRKVIQKR